MRDLVWIFLILLQEHGGLAEDADLPNRHEVSVNTATTGTGNHADKIVVKRYAKDPFERRSVDKNFIRFGRSGNYFHQNPAHREKNLLSYARVSRAAGDNFMRFGRGDEDQQILPITTDSEGIYDFQRIARAKDNFMRFGRAKDNFMRFGRSFFRPGMLDGIIYHKRASKGNDDFMRFGRGKDKDNFIRFGRAKDNFMRFGRAKDNFMRFGRAKDNFMRFGRNYFDDSIGIKDGSVRAELFDPPKGKKQTKSTKNDVGFIRFGRSDPEADVEDQKIDDDGSEIEGGGLDLQADKPKNGPIIRIKRGAQATLWDLENDRSRRDLEVMDDIYPGEKGLEKRCTDRNDVFEHDGDGDLLEPEEYSSEDFYGPDEVYFGQKRSKTKNNIDRNFIRLG